MKKVQQKDKAPVNLAFIGAELGFISFYK